MVNALMKADIVDSAVRGVHAHMMAYAHGRVNDDLMACMFATWRCGGGSLPDWMGLSRQRTAAETGSRRLVRPAAGAPSAEFPALENRREI